MTPTAMNEMSMYYEDLVGSTLGDRYELMEFIKAGGCSGVYRATDHRMQRNVAVKVLPSVDKMMAARFEQEAQALSTLQHPHTVAVYDFGRTKEGYLFMILEYLEGMPLKELMRTSRWLPPHRAVHVFSQIARSLHHAHKRGIIHRDVKPSNIFLVEFDGDPEFVKVLDFGVAKLLGVAETVDEDPTQTGRIIGTPRYMPPEQITSQEVDVRADVYSLGVLLYEMICGVVPFQDASLGGLLMKHLKKPPPPFDVHQIPHREQITPELESAVIRALAKQPQDRYASIDLFRSAVEASLGGAAIRDGGPARPAEVIPIMVDAHHEESPPPVPDDAEEDVIHSISASVLEAVDDEGLIFLPGDESEVEQGAEGKSDRFTRLRLPVDTAPATEVRSSPGPRWWQGLLVLILLAQSNERIL